MSDTQCNCTACMPAAEFLLRSQEWARSCGWSEAIVACLRPVQPEPTFAHASVPGFTALLPVVDDGRSPKMEGFKLL